MKNSTLFKRTILVIEDNDINREILSSIFSNEYKILEAENGKEGLDILKQFSNQISLVLLDIQMPVMNGFEFLNEIKNDDKLLQIPIVVTTSEKQEEEKCLILGASDFVSKPYSPNIILRRVEALIRLRESTNALKETKFDKVTGLFNREYFNYYSQRFLSDFQDKKYGFILVKIEDFGYINSSYGEEDGNRLLKYTADKLKTLENDGISFAKCGGDRFITIVDEEYVNYDELIQNIRNLFSDAPIKNIHYKIALYKDANHTLKAPAIANRLEEAIKSIYHNYYQDFILFNENMLEKENKVRFILENMEKSLEDEEFLVYYQPKHDSFTSELTGCEALVRWYQKDKGYICPGDFIPSFEENGFITKLDLYILDHVAKFIRKCIDNKMNIVPISINLSRRDLAIIESTEVIDNIVNKYNIDKKLIHFEITESFCGDGEVVINKTKMIRDSGYPIEIDDFGSGYSSLGLITDIPMDYLKLDISFIKKISSQKEVAKTIIQLAHIMNVKTIAEGVETSDQHNICKELGCDCIQGYYFAKPMPESDFVFYLKKHM